LANTIRHAVREERIIEKAFCALENALTPEIRTRTVTESKYVRGELKVTKVIQFEEHKNLSWPAVKLALETYCPEFFKKEDLVTELVVRFTDDLEVEREEKFEED
jgi:hypothetical protein